MKNAGKARSYGLYRHLRTSKEIIENLLNYYKKILENRFIRTFEVDRMIRILLSNKLGELKMTQADLARMTGIRPNTINELYNEFAERVNLQHLDLICEALNCDLSEILVYTPNTIPQVNRTRAGFKKRNTDSR